VRWRLKHAEYEYEVVYKAGKTNLNANALSRNPIPNLTLRIKKGPTQKLNPLRDTYISAREENSDSDKSLFNAEGHQRSSSSCDKSEANIETVIEIAELKNVNSQEIDENELSG